MRDIGNFSVKYPHGRSKGMEFAHVRTYVYADHLAVPLVLLSEH